jgi:hypothetical protein
MLKGILANQDYFNNAISDPEAPAVTQVGQRVEWLLGSMEPIAMKTTAKKSDKSKALAWAGFSPAPKYITNPQTDEQRKAKEHKEHMKYLKRKAREERP